MKIDYWYDGRKRESVVVEISCFFYPDTGIYAGNLYNATGKIIGDYTTKNSEEIEKRFSGIFTFGK